MSDLAPADERAFFAALAPRIAADLALLTEPPIRVEVVGDGHDARSAHLQLTYAGSSVELYVVGDDDKPDAALVQLLDLVLDSFIFDDVVDPWPRCPHHPDDGHSLAPVVFLGSAVWQCPIDHAVVSKVGSLNDNTAL